jgi:hypothetical protein
MRDDARRPEVSAVTVNRAPEPQAAPDVTVISETPSPAEAEAATAFPGPATDNSPPPELADHPRYRVLRLLGAGGMGTVWLAEHRHMRRPVALKVIRRELVRDDATALPRFCQEVQAAGRLSHPNIVAAHDADEAGGLHFLVTEYVDGTDLGAVVRERGALPATEASEFVRQAALGPRLPGGPSGADLGPFLKITHSAGCPLPRRLASAKMSATEPPPAERGVRA